MKIHKIDFPFPGIINIENLTAAIAMAINCGVSEDEIRKAALLFQGVRRRFDIRINRPGLVYIDDYAHHPEEIRAFIPVGKGVCSGEGKYYRVSSLISTLKDPDHAKALRVSLISSTGRILLPVYPAREKPIPV